MWNIWKNSRCYEDETMETFLENFEDIDEVCLVEFIDEFLEGFLLDFLE